MAADRLLPGRAWRPERHCARGCAPTSRGAGFALIELMVALALGLLVVGAVLAALLSALRVARHDGALAQLTDDAGLALALMRGPIAQAGFSVPHGVASAPGATPALVGHAFPPVFGCAGATFADPATGLLAGPACGPPSAAASPSDALEVARDASVLPGPSSNAILGASGAAAGLPLDCLGNSYPPTSGASDGGADYALDDSKFYVADASLWCHGPGTTAGAALAPNIEVLRVSYGLSAVAAGQPGADQVAYYDAAPAAGAAAWGQVVAVRLCVQARSAARVLVADAAATLGAYVDCDGVARVSTDGLLRRAFTTTVVLQNRLP